MLTTMVTAPPPAPFPTQLGEPQTPQAPQAVMPMPPFPLSVKSVVPGETTMAQMPQALAPQPAHTFDTVQRMSPLTNEAAARGRATARPETFKNLPSPMALRQCFPVARLEPLSDFCVVLQPAIPNPLARLVDLLLADPFARLANPMIADLLTRPANAPITGTLMRTPDLALPGLFPSPAKALIAPPSTVAAKIALPSAPELTAVEAAPIVRSRTIEPILSNARAGSWPTTAMAHVGTTAAMTASAEPTDIDGYLCYADRSQVIIVQSTPRHIPACR